MSNQNPLLAREFSQRDKVASRIKRTLGTCIQQLRNPKLGLVSVSDIVLSGDMRQAKIFVGIMGCATEDDAQSSLAILSHATGFLQHELRSNCRLRVVPRLRFFYNKANERGMRVESLLRNERTSQTPK